MRLVFAIMLFLVAAIARTVCMSEATGLDVTVYWLIITLAALRCALMGGDDE